MKKLRAFLHYSHHRISPTEVSSKAAYKLFVYHGDFIA